MKKSLLFKMLSLLVVASFALAACGAPATEAPTSKLGVGIVLPTKDEPRWIQDETRFTDALTAKGYDVEILFSQGDSAKEKSNVESLITKGIKVLILTPQDGAAAAAAADAARAAGVKVISYDRLILNTDAVDFYVTFDSIAVGAAQAQYLVDKASGSGNPLYLYAGAASDNNAFLFFQGAWKVLQPKIADGTFLIKNSSEAVALKDKADLTRDEQGKIIGQITTNWDFNTAKSLAESNLTSAKAADKGNVFILAPNDGTARAIADSFGADKDVKSYVVTGQDAEQASVQYIIDGKQSMTVLKDVRTLVNDAINAAVTFLNGQTPAKTTTYNNGKIDVPAKPSEVISVDQSNLKAAIIDSGYWPASDFTGLDTLGAAPEPAADVALRWRTRPDNQEEIDVYSKISTELDAELDGITLAYEPGGTEGANYQDQLRSEVAAGTAPDVFWIPGTDVADFATRGLILNMSDVASGTEGFDVKAFYPGPMFHLSYNPENSKSGADSGALWGLPRDVSTFALYLNLDLINEAGAADPRELAKEGKWDWDAFLDVAQKTRALGSDIYGYGASAWWGPYGVWLNASGGGFFSADRAACNLNSTESLKGLEFQRSLYQDYDVATPYGEDPEPPFRAGKVAMFQNGRWATPGVRTVDFNWDVVQLPNGPQGTPGNWLFWGAYVVNAKTEHPEEAWKLVQALTTAETQGKVAALGANIPSRVSQEALDAFVTFTPPDNNQAFLDGIADSAKPTAEGPLWAGSWPEFDKIMGPAIQGVLTGATSVDDFGSTICDEANKVFTK